MKDRAVDSQGMNFVIGIVAMEMYLRCDWILLVKICSL